MSPVAQLQDVSVSYDGSQPVLRSLNLTIRPGERWVVLGPNGSGKTTLVQILTGWLHASSGDVVLLGERLGEGVDWRRHRTRIGVVSAAFAKLFRRELTALDVVMTAKFAALEPWWHEYTESDRTRAYSLLEAGGFGYVASREFGVLSEGERQQVLLARSLMGSAELLVLDEPFAGLDLGAREHLIRRLSTLCGDPSSPPLVLVTHHVEEIPVGATHALLLRDGLVVASGEIATVLTSERISQTFGLAVELTSAAGRFSARAV
jgi:iron complex transport system ATP-binding protein